MQKNKQNKLIYIDVQLSTLVSTTYAWNTYGLIVSLLAKLAEIT